MPSSSADQTATRTVTQELACTVTTEAAHLHRAFTIHRLQRRTEANDDVSHYYNYTGPLSFRQSHTLYGVTSVQFESNQLFLQKRPDLKLCNCCKSLLDCADEDRHCIYLDECKLSRVKTKVLDEHKSTQQNTHM